MANQTNKLKWCKARVGKDNNWWVYETSDKVNWDYDGISVLDPRQAAHMVEALQSIKDYGLDENIVENAFYTFSIDSKDGDKGVKLVLTNESVMDPTEQVFLFPNTLDDERSHYAEFLNHITSLQVKMLNDTFHFEEDLTIEDLEDEVREHYNSDYMEGKAIHAFYEIMDILEYVPDGYSLEDDDSDEDDDDSDEDEYDEIEDLPDDEYIEQDDTMHWDDEDEDSEHDDYGRDMGMHYDDDSDRY